MITRRRLMGAVVAFFVLFGTALYAQQTQLKSAAKSGHPKIVLFSTSWCPICMRAKQYMTVNKIPFINRDVEIDLEARQLITEKYKSKGVPVFVVGEGSDEIVLQGFTVASLNEAIEKAKAKK